jgi:hypothetical protein
VRRIRESRRLVDIETGDGVRFATLLRQAGMPPSAAATEDYAPNVTLARANLEPRSSPRGRRHRSFALQSVAWLTPNSSDQLFAARSPRRVAFMLAGHRVRPWHLRLGPPVASRASLNRSRSGTDP